MDICSLGNYYYYKEPIGVGSYSTIYRGHRYNDTNTIIAVKKIQKIMNMSHFNNEIDIMRRINHKHILRLYDIVHTNDYIYLILEYCNGGDLLSYIQTKSITNDHIYLHQIIDGFEYLHNNQILHRDIKPRNILIHNNNIKISDFGLAKYITNTNMLSSFCGSPLYMSPELLSGNKYDYKSDIWSVGVIIFELITKSHPYNTHSKADLLNMPTNGYYINFDLISDNEIKQLLISIFNNNPANRCDWSQIIEYNNNYANNVSCKEDTIDDQFKIPVSQSINIRKLDERIIDNGKDQVISRSAPKEICDFVNYNYLKNKTNIMDKNNELLIIGHSPSFKPKGYIEQSYSAIKKIINFKL